MDTDERLPGQGLLPCRRWWDTMALEDVADRLVTDRIAQISQRPHNAIIPPRAVLSGHTHHEIFTVPDQGEDVQQTCAAARDDTAGRQAHGTRRGSYRVVQ